MSDANHIGDETHLFLKHNCLLVIILYGKVHVGKRRRCPRKYNLWMSILASNMNGALTQFTQLTIHKYKYKC